jgi:hypothetical protein
VAAGLVVLGVVAVGATWARRELAPPLPSAGLEAMVAGGAQPASEGVDGGATFAQYVPMMEQARALAADGGLALALTLLDDEVKRAERSSDRRAEAFALRNRGNLALVLHAVGSERSTPGTGPPTKTLRTPRSRAAAGR